jgi:hypothetical protein
MHSLHINTLVSINRLKALYDKKEKEKRYEVTQCKRSAKFLSILQEGMRYTIFSTLETYLHTSLIFTT